MKASAAVMPAIAWMVFAAPCDAQWRRFGGNPEARAATAMAGEMLAGHNETRARVGAPPLTWSRELAAVAQDWANTLMARDQFNHRPGTPFGENLFEVRGGSASPAEVVGRWSAQARNYDHKSNRCRGVCGHYTQVVWRATRRVGCGVAREPGREVWVCNYDPPGNVAGETPY